nr:DNA mismatch endonuclease Vsr [Mesorhizobium ciceri]
MSALSSSSRSLMMSKVRSRDTVPEIRVRKLAHELGFRFRVHRRDLPGTPDLVFPRYKIAIFVHGCFWHRHPGCDRTSTPSTNIDFWLAKFERNQLRDAQAITSLESMGWQVHVIWECDTRTESRLRDILSAVLATGAILTSKKSNLHRNASSRPERLSKEVACNSKEC